MIEWFNRHGLLQSLLTAAGASWWHEAHKSTVNEQNTPIKLIQILEETNLVQLLNIRNTLLQKIKEKRQKKNDKREKSINIFKPIRNRERAGSVNIR